MTLTVEIP